VRRREFISLIGGAAAWPLVARAQKPGAIGFLHVASAAPFAHLVAAFRQGLSEGGHVDGQNAAIEFRWADGHYDRLPALAADLVRRQVDIIVTGGGEPSALAAKAATPRIPIVFNTGSDPVKAGLVASLGRPAGNATGVNIFTVEFAAKRLGLLHDVVPAGALFALLVNPNFPTAEADAKETEAAARAIGRPVLVLMATNETELDAVFATILQRRAGAVLVGVDPFFNSRRDQIVALAARYAIPAVYEQREFALAGGLMSYGTSLTEAYRQQGVYAGRILKGEKPSELPVMQLSKFELVINLKSAKALGLTFPSGLLAIADEVIE
jgi:putative ABC transport system substrate-binding protein